jgi:ABC-type antimicrobial peptide transport system ATPase subunit
LRINATPEKSATLTERLTYKVVSENGTGKISLAWENLVVTWEMR